MLCGGGEGKWDNGLTPEPNSSKKNKKSQENAIIEIRTRYTKEETVQSARPGFSEEATLSLFLDSGLCGWRHQEVSPFSPRPSQILEASVPSCHWHCLGESKKQTSHPRLVLFLGLRVVRVGRRRSDTVLLGCFLSCDLQAERHVQLQVPGVSVRRASWLCLSPGLPCPPLDGL